MGYALFERDHVLVALLGHLRDILGGCVPEGAEEVRRERGLQVPY